MTNAHSSDFPPRLHLKTARNWCKCLTAATVRRHQPGQNNRTRLFEAFRFGCLRTLVAHGVHDGESVSSARSWWPLATILKTGADLRVAVDQRSGGGCVISQHVNFWKTEKKICVKKFATHVLFVGRCLV